MIMAVPRTRHNAQVPRPITSKADYQNAQTAKRQQYFSMLNIMVADHPEALPDQKSQCGR
jgi:hypothetical protein